jgi:hypothetical protein
MLGHTMMNSGGAMLWAELIASRAMIAAMKREDGH